MRSLVMVGVTHSNAELADLECVAVDAEESSVLSKRIITSRIADEVVVVSTCNRTELYLAGDVDVEACLDEIASGTRIARERLSEIATVLRGGDASRHLFRVAAGLDSRLVGEREILGQIRTAVANARQSHTSGPALEALFRYGVAAGRRTRRAVGRDAAPSLAAVALDAADIETDDPRVVLVIGAGSVAAAVASELRRRRVGFFVAARRPAQAVPLVTDAERVIGLEDMTDRLGDADVVVSATGARHHVVTEAHVARAMKARTAMTLIDLALPRDVDPAVRAFPGVTVRDLSELDGAEAGDTPRRQFEAIEVEHRRYEEWMAGQTGSELIASLRQGVFATCLTEAESAGFGPEAAQRLAHRISGRLLHRPTLAVKEHIMAGRVELARALVETMVGAESTSRVAALAIAS